MECGVVVSARGDTAVLCGRVLCAVAVVALSLFCGVSDIMMFVCDEQQRERERDDDDDDHDDDDHMLWMALFCCSVLLCVCVWWCAFLSLSLSLLCNTASCCGLLSAAALRYHYDYSLCFLFACRRRVRC